MRTIAAIALTVLCAAGCRIPEDPDGTLDRVEGGTMRVGVVETDPWVSDVRAGEPAGGVEVELVRDVARDLGARIEWTPGSEEELVRASREGDLDLVVGGMTSKTRWKHDVALTRPYVELGDEKHVMAVRMGENAFLVRLERFLLNREEEIGRLIRAEGTR
jgi:polar amino acid transport system substrate-binding protein